MRKSIYIFIPLGNYRYIWTANFKRIYLLYDTYVEGRANLEGVKRKLYQRYKEEYSTKGLMRTVSLNKEFEAIFDCDFYTLVNPDYWDTLKEQLFE